jgi:hypothetical protein
MLISVPWTYTDVETIQHLEKLRLHFKVSKWMSHIGLEYNEPGTDVQNQLSTPPLFLERYPWVTKTFLVAPLGLYMVTRLATNVILTGVQNCLIQLYNFLPKFIRFLQRSFRSLGYFILWVRSVVILLVSPIWESVLYPAFEYIATTFIKTTIDMINIAVDKVPKIIAYCKTNFKTLGERAYVLLQSIIRLAKGVNDNYILPFILKSRQIAIRIYPRLKQIILTLVGICEALDNRIRPIINAWAAWISKNTHWVNSFALTVYHVISDMLTTMFFAPRKMISLFVIAARTLYTVYIQPILHAQLKLFNYCCGVLEANARHAFDVSWIYVQPILANLQVKSRLAYAYAVAIILPQLRQLKASLEALGRQIRLAVVANFRHLISELKASTIYISGAARELVRHFFAVLDYSYSFSLFAKRQKQKSS